MITFERPLALAACLFVVPAIAFLSVRIAKITRSLTTLSAHADDDDAPAAVSRIRRALLAKLVMRSLAWLAFCLALSGLSWGTRLVPVQKSGDAVCFVFDISYSMTADDGGGGLSRLAAARLYADRLLSHLEGTSVAAVLAKGDGVVAVPMTEDYAALHSLVENLSPLLMSAAGSSLGKGIRAALGAFPAHSAQEAHIWVFTDGDETDSAMEAALEDAVRYGVPVTLVGFGSERGTTVTAGDGKTSVHTALQAQNLALAAERANKHALSAVAGARRPLVRYEDAAASGSAYRLLQELSTPQAAFRADGGAGASADSGADAVYSYEAQPVQRYKGCLLLAVLLFALSFVAAEGRLPAPAASSRTKRAAQALLVLAPLATLSSCAVGASGKLSLLSATWNWQQKDYQQATVGFLRVYADAPNALARDYARFGLSATYLMQEEYDAALAKLDAVDLLAADCTPELKSAVQYNKGVLAHQRGDYEVAAACFKAAILANDKNTSAKINLELTERQRSASRAQSAETEMRQVAESKDDSALEQGIFNLIKEQEQEQWKKLQANTKPSDVIDY